MKKSFFFRWMSACAALLFLPGCALFEPFNGDLQHFHTVVIDPGHGGYDCGARAICGADEKLLTLDVAQRLKPLLEKKGYRVLMTRTNDTFIPLGMRIALANAHADSIFVSIHFNSSPSRAAKGIEAYYYSNRSSEQLATRILCELTSTSHCRYRGVKPAVYYVLHHNNRPATLLELGFISNAQENATVQKPATRQELAEKIARGIENARAL